MNRNLISTMLCVTLAVLGGWGLVGCGANPESSKTDSSEEGRPIQVVSTVGMVADLVRNVGGDRVDVVQICGAGVDPHLYKASRDDVAKLMNADVIFYSGLMLEGKMADTLVKVARNKPVVAVTEAIEPDDQLHPPEMDGHTDPHVWMDVGAWKQCIAVITDELSAIAPQHSAQFALNANAYLEQMTQLDEYGKKVIATIPESKRVLITSHDAFNYFGRAYGIQVDAVQGISTESEAGLSQINRLVKQIVDKQIEAVFVESSVSPKNIQALIEGARSQSHEVKIGGELFSDAMGPDGSYEGTYLGMMDHNLTTVARTLGGEAPERGLNGKLE